jgi:hypothetical protein
MLLAAITGIDQSYSMFTDAEVEGYELNCNKKNADGAPKKDCKIKGNHLNLMDECDLNKQCEGFVVSATANGNFGYLIGTSGTGKTQDRRNSPGTLYFVKSCDNPTRPVKCSRDK